LKKRNIRQTLTLLTATVTLCGGLAVGATGAGATTNQPQPTPPATEARLPTGAVSSSGDAVSMAVHLTITGPELLTVNHCYQTPKACLIFQSDGNLVVYDEKGTARWNSGTWGYTNAYAVFQADGNLVVYSHTNIPLWHSQTGGNTPGTLTLWVQSDGNVVIYDKAGIPWWAAHTEH
jgi:hypothetical protein